jgi:hypothetical protein
MCVWAREATFAATRSLIRGVRSGATPALPVLEARTAQDLLELARLEGHVSRGAALCADRRVHRATAVAVPGPIVGLRRAFPGIRSLRVRPSRPIASRTARLRKVAGHGTPILIRVAGVLRLRRIVGGTGLFRPAQAASRRRRHGPTTIVARPEHKGDTTALTDDLRFVFHDFWPSEMSIRSACEGIRRGGFGGISEEAPMGAQVGAPEPATDTQPVKHRFQCTRSKLLPCVLIGPSRVLSSPVPQGRFGRSTAPTMRSRMLSSEHWH